MPALDPQRGFAEVVLDGRIGSFRPTCLAAVGLRWELLGSSPDAHHAAQLLLHVANAGLLAWLARTLGLSVRRAGFAGALFLLAPLRLDAAANLHAACDVMVTTLCLGFLLLWLHQRRGTRLAAAVILALLAVTTKETAFVVLPACAAWALIDRGDEARWTRPQVRREIRPLAWLAGALALVFLLRAAVLQGVAGSYAVELWGTGPGVRGVIAGLIASVIPFREVLGLSDLSHLYLPAEFRRPLMVALAIAAIACGVLVARRLRPRRARRFAVLFMLTSSVPFLFSVNERSAYVTGAAAAIWLATLEVPRRLDFVAPGFVLAVLVFGVTARIEAYGQAARIALGTRAAAIDGARRRDAARVLLVASPDEAFGARANATSECFARIDPAAVQVLVAFRGVSPGALGPEITVAPGRAQIEADGGFLFSRDDCVAAPRLPPGLEATVACEQGVPRLITIHRGPGTMPVALFNGPGELRWIP